MLTAFLTALLATVAAQAAPGPNLLAVASIALSRGRTAAIMVAAGVASGVWIWVSVCVFGVASLFERFPQLLTVFQILGGGYFLFIAWRSLRALRKGKISMIRADDSEPGLSAAYRRGLMVVLTNPKAGLMWMAITTFLFGAGLTESEVIWFTPIGSLSAFIVYSIYGWVFSTGVARNFYQRSAKAFEAVFGALFGFLGLSLIAEGIGSALRFFQGRSI